MSEAMQNLLTRRSVRKYREEQIPDEVLDQILEAGIYAPSGMNTQGGVLVAVRDKEIRNQLSRMNAAVLGVQSDPFYGAPCVIVVLADPELYGCWVEDGSLIMGNLMNAAHALGLGSCWVNRARQMFDTQEGKELLKAWGLPQNLRGVGNCIVGYPLEMPEPRERKKGRIVKIG